MSCHQDSAAVGQSRDEQRQRPSCHNTLPLARPKCEAIPGMNASRESGAQSYGTAADQHQRTGELSVKFTHLGLISWHLRSLSKTEALCRLPLSACAHVALLESCSHRCVIVKGQCFPACYQEDQSPSP